MFAGLRRQLLVFFLRLSFKHLLKCIFQLITTVMFSLVITPKKKTNQENSVYGIEGMILSQIFAFYLEFVRGYRDLAK